MGSERKTSAWVLHGLEGGRTDHGRYPVGDSASSFLLSKLYRRSMRLFSHRGIFQDMALLYGRNAIIRARYHSPELEEGVSAKHGTKEYPVRLE